MPFTQSGSGTAYAVSSTSDLHIQASCVREASQTLKFTYNSEYFLLFPLDFSTG